ncbi:MAG: amino acid adenylation domain-containing protein, partial [Acidobacteria bacterium]|nr:amino acid adenylation domain-containing protein [Acidobacteriota bacterium]
GVLSYNRDLFEATTAARWSRHLETLLEAVAEDSYRRVGELPVLSETERHQLVLEWNDALPASVVEEDLCLHHLFEQQAVRTPEAVAVVAGETRWTYAELNRRANHLAAHLLNHGVGPEVRVAVCLSRSAAMVAGLLAILKAGGAYVPLDPEYPEERLTYVLEDARVALLLTESSLEPRLPLSDLPRLRVDELDPPDGAAPPADPAGGATAANLAYLIHTSGSTGRPKGVAICHRSPVVLARWARRVFSDSELSGVLAATSICFDLSVFEIFVPLAWGGTVVVASNALELPALSAAGEVRLINTVPSAVAGLVASTGLPPSVQTVNLAGEALKGSLVRQIFETSTDVERVLNLYGPSEDTTYSTFTPIGRGETGEPTIGRPLAETRALVLDRQLRPVPPGVVGELYLGGSGLARGYFHRPGLSAERFLPDAWSGVPGARLYRTGDRVRLRGDGELVFLGRADHQVKLRGFRIELGEIEAALEEHPSVRERVVVARPDDQGDLRLLAYLVADGAEPSAAELRDFLQAKLPHYMVP